MLPVRLKTILIKIIHMFKDDTVLGSTLDNMNNLGPGETWQFKAIITDNECNKYTIVGVTGF